MPDATPDGPERHRADQDQQIAADLDYFGRVLDATLNEPRAIELLTPIELLAPDAFGEDGLHALVALLQQARDDYAARARASAATAAASEAKKPLRRDALRLYAKFRRTTRALFRHDPAARTALGLDDDVPDALGLAVTQARTAYTNAGLAPYAERTAKRGYPAERLAERLAGLAALDAATEALDRAEAQEIEATTKRDASYGAIHARFGEFRETARPILEDEPELLRRIGL